MKRCKLCKVEKEKSAFYCNVSSEDGLRARCKDCENAERKRRKQPGAEEFKLCNGCGQVLPSSAFGFHPTEKSGRRSRCFPCHAAYMAAWRAENPGKTREIQGRSNVQRREKYATDEEYRATRRKESKAQYHAMSLEEKRRQGHQNHLRTAYNLSPEEYEALKEKQENRCACCGKTPRPTRKNPRAFEVDHDHGTKRVRGLLCRSCNGGIGLLGDTIEGLRRALAYLEGSG